MALRTALLGMSQRLFAPATTSTTTILSRPFSTTFAKFKDKSAGTPDSMRDFLSSSSMRAPDFQAKSELSASLEAYSGRSIGNVTNATVAYRRLNNILSKNNVRRELRAKRYYEKPAVARRRKKIERNRKLFAALVGKKVGLIMQMKSRYAFDRWFLLFIFSLHFANRGM